MADWVALPDGVTWRGEAVGWIDTRRAAIEARFGPPVMVDLDSNGIGLFDAWAVRFACGLEVCVWVFHERGGNEVYAGDADAEHVAFHLALGPVSPMVPLRAPRFRVVRLDDNGGTYEMRRTTSRCEAEAIARAYEARGHRQTYWVAEI